MEYTRSKNLDIDWIPKYECNYSCPYCPYYCMWGRMDCFKNLLPYEQWLEKFKSIYNKQGRFNLNIKGGNPFTYPNWIDLINQLTSYCDISIRSNLCFDLKKASRIDANKVNIRPFYHPLFETVGEFAEKVRFLSQYGFKKEVFYFAYPKQLKQFDYYKRELSKIKIDFSIVSLEKLNSEDSLLHEEDVSEYDLEEIDLSEKYFLYVTPEGKCRFKATERNKQEAEKDIYLTNIEKRNKSSEEIEAEENRVKNTNPELTWFFWHKCNYRCSYCFYNGKWEEQDNYFENLTLEEILRTWDKIYYKYGSSDVGLAGAEPTIYPQFYELVKELTQKHKVNFNTNLSLNMNEIKEIVDSIDSSKIVLTGSFHPEFSNIGQFIRKTSLLKDNGFLSGQEVVCVGWPPILNDLEKYKKEFSKSGINFRVQPFNGEFKEKNYPKSYTKKEKEIIYSLTEDQNEENERYVCYQIGDVNPKGKLCRAGQVRAEIGGNGIVYRCSQCKKEPLGNFLNGNFELLDKPLPCESTYCPCDFKYLVDYDQ